MSLFRNKTFVTIISIEFILQFGLWVRNLSIMFFIMDQMNGDPLAISTLNFLEYVPLIVFTFVGGFIADRYNPRRVMLLGDVFSMLSFVVLGMLIAKGWILSIFGAVLISATLTQFAYPASQKYIKQFVPKEQLESAIGFSQLIGSLFYVIGPFLGSYFYFHFGMNVTIFTISALYFVSLILVYMLPKTTFIQSERVSIRKELQNTIGYIKQNDKMIALFKMYALLSFAMGIGINLDIFLVTERLQLDETYYQLFSGIAGIGAIAGGFLYLGGKAYLDRPPVLIGIILSLAVTFFFEGYSTIVNVTLVLQFIDNALLGILNGYVVALVMKETNQAFLGKVSGLTFTIMYAGITFGTLFSGFTLKYTSLVFSFTIGSIAIVLTLLFKIKPLQYSEKSLQS